MTISGAASSSSSSKTVLLTPLSFFQSVKAFQIFSLFKSTRVLLRIVIEIVKDMIPFMLFVVATTIAVSLLFASATPDAALTNTTYSDFLLHVYRLDFGDFALDNYSTLDFAIFILAVLIVPLVFLNMLIAIMGDIFDRVKEEQGRRDLQEMGGLVYRYESIAHSVCKGKKHKRVWKYIFVSGDVKYSGEEAIDEWQGRIRGIKLEIEKVLKKQDEERRENEERKKEHQAEREKNEERYKENEVWKERAELQLSKNEQLLSKILEQVKEIRGD